MSAANRDLGPIDPRAVPLPNGTEVTTRVDRVVGEGRVPQGAVDRVSASRGDDYDVQIVGGAVATYRREELLPRKSGQVRFAMKRAARWDALRRCAVLEATVGSHAWGLADESSDTDLRGVFVAPAAWTQGLVPSPTDLVSTDGSTTYWEVDKTIRQALRADPNTLELLFVDSARALDPMGQWILDARDAFVSAELYGTFGRYAVSQLKKLQQSLRLAEHRALLLDWLRHDVSPSIEEVAARLARETAIAAPTSDDALLLAKEYVKQLYRSLYDQGLLASRDFDSLIRFARTRDPAFELPRELRPKNAYNLLRLVGAAITWLRTGAPSLRVSGPFRDQLLAIKRGAVPLEQVLADAERMMPELEEARRSTQLPVRGDLRRADALLRRIRQEAARRSVLAEPGPFGRDAPSVPESDWEGE
jgi:hypothetical protein